jgi:FHS family glucose/mannose:H+ symporter-like MFS transporter
VSFTPPEGASTSSDVTFGSVAFANATATFLMFGATSSLFGPLLVSFSHRFHLTLPAAGVVLSIFFVGALLGVPLGYLGVKRFRGNTAIAALMIVAGLGALTAALSRNWPEFLTGVFIFGVAFGGVDFSLNTLLVRTEVKHRGHRLSLANAGYGVGAVVGPVLIIVVRPTNFPVLFGAIGGTALVLSAFFRDIDAPPMHSVHHRSSLVAKGRRRSILLTFIAAYILYVAVETSASGWIAPQLHRVGYSQTLASVVTAGFWGGLALGRVVGGPLAKRWSERSLVIGGLALAVFLSLASFFNAVAPFCYPALGLITASVYPMGLIWYTTLCPGDGDGLATLILCMMVGGIIGPAIESLMVSLTNIHAVPVVIAIFALLDLSVFASATRFD